MPCRYGTVSADRLRVEFVEADIEMCFHLVDLAEVEWKRGHVSGASRILEDAECVFKDAGQRLERFDAFKSAAFVPLVGELRRAINLAHHKYRP